MIYSVELVQRTNIRYQEAALHLCRCELLSMLSALQISAPVNAERLGGIPFLTFECRELSPEELSILSRHSSLSLIAERQGDLLRPLLFPEAGYLPADLPEVLKYKGKTGVPFTRMMINIALSLVPGALRDPRITLFDPLCGKGTSLFCALQDGLNAVGLDRDERAIHEAAEYFARYLKYHQLKHTRRARSETLRRGSLPVTEFLFSSDKEHYLAGDTRQLTLSTGDTEWSPALFRKKTADVIVADLPYGIQHAPQGSQRTETFQALLSRSLPAWRQALRADGALAISFNTYTLPTRTVQESLRRAGWTVCDQPPLTGLQHEVEQAVVRDVVFAINNKGGSPHDSE